MIYTAKEYEAMTPAELLKQAARSADEAEKQLKHKCTHASILRGIRKAYEEAARFQMAANSGTHEQEEADALAREAAAIRNTIATIFHA